MQLDDLVVLDGQIMTGALKMRNLNIREKDGEREREQGPQGLVRTQRYVSDTRQRPARDSTRSCIDFHLHKVAANKRFADVCVVVLAGELCAHTRETDAVNNPRQL